MVNVKDFVTEAFDYADSLRTCSTNLSVNRYLLEYVAYGFAMYGRNPESFINNVDDWLRKGSELFPELGFDHEANQVYAVIDLIDQILLIDDSLVSALSDAITILEKFGLLIHYKSNSRNIDKTSTLLGFFETVEGIFPVIKDRFKGLGSTDASVLREMIMDPKTRRIIRVNMSDAETMTRMGYLVGKDKNDIAMRKQMLLNFKYDMNMIDT